MRKLIAVLAAVAMLLAVLPTAVAATGSPAKRIYTTNSDFDEGVLVGVEDATVPDQLQLSKEVTTLPFIWVPNNNGTVSKVDTETGNELGRYFVTPPGLPDGGSPSRTTVDLEGNVWVGNRMAGTVVKIGLLEAGQCVDRNGNGTIDTARDTNTDGSVTADEVLPWGSDECVLYEVVLVPGQEGPHVPGTYTGPYDTEYWGVSPRSLAVDGQNNLWAGTGSTQKFYYIDGATGAIRNVVDVSQWQHQAYGATIDRNGVLWSLRPLLRIDPAGLAAGASGLAAATASPEPVSRKAVNPYTAGPSTLAPQHALPPAAATKAGGSDRSRRTLVSPVPPATLKDGRVKSAGDKPMEPMGPIMTASGEAVIGTSFTTNYNYDTQGDSLGNISAVMHTQVHGAAVCPPQPVSDTMTVDLNSAYPLSRTWTSGQPASPPAGTDYRWTFLVSPDWCGGFAAGETDQTATLTTGFTVSRAVDQRQFTGTGPFTQTLTVTMTPAEAFRDLRINGHSDVSGLDATIQSISGGDYNIYPDGRGFDLWVDNPTPGQQYTWQVTIRIESLPAGFQGLDYMPDLQAGGFVTITEGESPGTSVAGTSPGLSGEPLAAWTWRSTGDYRWQWRQVVGKLVHLAGSISDPLAPEAQVWAGLETLYSYDSPTDSVENSPVEMRAGVNTNLFNFPDGSGLPVVDPILDLSSAYPMPYTDSSGQRLPPPAGVSYRWGFPDIAEGSGGWANAQTQETAQLAPGFAASREADRSTFTGPGTQVVTLRVTPAEPIDRLQIQGWTDVNGFSAQLRSVSGPGVNEHGDGRSFDAAVEAPEVGQTYVWTIEAEIPELPAGFQALTYMPELFVQNMHSTAEGVQDGSSLVRETEFATWAWQAAGSYRWYWQQSLGKQVHMMGVLADPLAPTEQVWANFQSAYGYYTADDLADNPTVNAPAEVFANLDNRPEGSTEPVSDSTLDLSSPFPFQDTWSSGEPATPPAGVAYRWQFPSIPVGSGAYAGGRTDQSAAVPAGMTVSRTVDQRRFQGPGTQVLRLAVIPHEPMAALAVNGNVNINGLDAVVASIAGEDGYPYPDAHGFGAWVENPTVGRTYEWEVTIDIRSLPAGYRSLEFVPEISAENVQRVSDGSTDGDHVTASALDLGGQELATWTWQAAATYRWHWRNTVTKRVGLNGTAYDPEAPVRAVPLNGGTYALAPDYLGNLFITGYDQNKLYKLDTATDKVLFAKDTPAGCARGVAITTDNNVWVADTCRNSVLRYDNDGNLLAEIGGLSQPSGVAVDGAGKVWATDMASESIHRIDPTSNAIDLSKELPGTGGHYSYSDMTGMVSRTISTTTGTWTVVHDSGQAATPWGSIDWTSREPGGTAITVRVRSSEDQIAWSAWETAQAGEPLTQTPDGRYIQIEAAFRITSGNVSPILYDLTVSPGAPAGITVPVDIKPTSCPNPVNWTDKGTLPLAILGTAEFDATQVDPESVRLAGVAPQRWALEDVATPYGGTISDPPDRMNCTTDGPDGIQDLTLKFDVRAVVAALGTRSDGAVVVVQLTGRLRDGTPITGQDVIWVVRNKK